MAQTHTENLTTATESWRGWRRNVFYAIVTVLLVGVGIVFWKVNLFPILAWLPEEFLNGFYASQLEFDHITHGDFGPHVIHYLAISATHWSLMIGLALQYRNPLSKVAPMWQVTGGMTVVTLTYPFADVSRIPPPVFAIIALAVVAGLLHPGRIFRTAPRFPDKAMLGLGLAAAIPIVFLIVDQLGLQASGVDADPHWQGLHYNFMGEFGLVFLLVLALGASSLPGWRYSVWTGGFLAALMGMGFVVYPDMSSSQGLIWGLALVGFAALWVKLGQRRYRTAVGARG